MNKSLKNDDMEFLDEILTNQLMEAEESENEAIRARFKACNDGKLVEKTVELIHFIGSNIVRETLELFDDQDLENFEDEEMEE